MDYLIVVLFLISIGSMNIHRAENADSMAENSIIGKLLLSILPLVSFYYITILISKIVSIKWYWSLIISIFALFILSGIFASIYSSIFGIKSKPQLSLNAGGYVKHNIYLADAMITFVLGLILYFVFS